MRPNVIPNPVMVSDTWPKSEIFWVSIFPELRGGRLGLFYFMNRMIKTLRESHADYALAVRELQFCCYSYHPEDESKLYGALKDGSFNGTKHTEEKIAEMKLEKRWNKRFSPYLRKVIHDANIIKTKLADFKIKFKVTATEGQPAAQGRIDPMSKKHYSPT